MTGRIPGAPDKSSGLPLFLRSAGKIFLGVSEGYVRCEETDGLGGVSVNEFPDTPRQYGANEKFASRTIIPEGSALPATTQFFEVGDELFFVHVGERCGETVGWGPEF